MTRSNCHRLFVVPVGRERCCDSWSRTPLLFWMLSLAGFSLPRVFHDHVAVGSRGWAKISGGGSSMKVWPGLYWWYCPQSFAAHFILYNTGESAAYFPPRTWRRSGQRGDLTCLGRDGDQTRSVRRSSVCAFQSLALLSVGC